MPKQHVIQQGECLSSVAELYGLFIPTIWNDPANRELRTLRGNPHVLLPGDVVVIPNKRNKGILCATGKRHVFRRKGVPEKFRLQLLDEDEQPRAGVPYVFEVRGKQHRGTTNSAGWIDEWIPNSEKHATLLVGDELEEEYDIRLGALDPVGVESGARARLHSLGYLGTEDADHVLYQAALGAFQGDYGVPVTLELDAATTARLREVYGS